MREYTLVPIAECSEIERSLLNFVRKQGPLSRVELAERTGFSKSSISIYVSNLIKTGLVYEDNRGDRKKGDIRIRENSAFVIGIDLGATSVDIGLCNLEGTILNSFSVAVSVTDGPQPVMDLIVSGIDTLLTRHQQTNIPLLGIGIGLPGYVHYESAEVTSQVIMPGWSGYNIRQKLEERFGCPIFADNDVNAMAIGEKTYGLAKDVDHFIFVKIGTGIGAGVILKGEIYRGARGSAGDIGHVGIEGVNVRCKCGNLGCLETIASGSAITREAYMLAEGNKSPRLKELFAEKGYLETKDVKTAADYGDGEALELIIRSGRYIGKILAKLTCFYNPSLIVIGGNVTKLGEKFIAAIKEEIFAKSLPIASHILQIQQSEMVETVGMRGTAEMAMNEIFSNKDLLYSREFRVNKG